MVRIVRRERERELTRLLALREGNGGLPDAVGAEQAPAGLGKLAMARGLGVSPESLRPRVALEHGLEARRSGPARLAPRSGASVRRARRRHGYPRPVPPTDLAAPLGLTPERARAWAGDLLAVCRTLAEALEGLDAVAQALLSLPAFPIEGAERDPRQPARVAPECSPAAGREYPDGLTRREVEVLLLVAEGQTSKEIAAQLCVAVPTVSRHLANIYAKIDARGRADATRYALEHLDDELAARREVRLG